jgi:hypothetical protein
MLLNTKIDAQMAIIEVERRRLRDLERNVNDRDDQRVIDLQGKISEDQRVLESLLIQIENQIEVTQETNERPSEG